jgi:hypothetical protein
MVDVVIIYLVCSALHKNQYLVIIPGFIPLFFQMLIEVLWLLIVMFARMPIKSRLYTFAISAISACTYSKEGLKQPTLHCLRRYG